VIVGCSVNPGVNPEPVDIAGKVTLGGRPVSDVTLNHQVTGNGTEAAFPVKAGEFRGKATPGRYTYYLSEGPKPAAYKAVPVKFRRGSLDRQIDIAAGTTVTITLD
jgi:hypothetical protein